MGEPDLDTLRAMVREGVENQGLKRIAGQVGMSASGLRHFLGGASSFPLTQRKVRAWSQRYARGDDRSRREVLVDELVQAVPPAARAAMRRHILDLVAGATDPAAAPAGAPGGSVVVQPIVYVDLRP